MHIFIMLITSFQSFKLIACTPWEELITQTCYPTLKANLKIVLSLKCHNFVKNYFFICKTSHAHFLYIHNKYARFQTDPLKTVRAVDHTNSIPNNAKSCQKWLSSKGCNSVKINFSSIKNPHAHIFNMSTTCMQGFKKIHWKLWEELITQALYYKVWRMDGQMDRKTGANLNAPYRHGGIRKAVILSKSILAPSKTHMHTSSICPQHVCKVSKRSIENCGRSWLHKLYTVKCDEWTYTGA